MIPEPPAHRAICPRCRRPETVCYCAHLVSLPTRTRVVLLQHPREQFMPVGTARLAHLCLPESELHVGVDFDDNPKVQAALAGEDGRPAYLLFPGPNAIDISEVKVDRPITLVVVDGTWWLARKLTRRNAGLGALPQVRFTPPAPSRYRIRKEPAEHCVATVEALAHVLGVLERDPARFATLLKPFEAMIDRQLDFATHVRGARRRHALHRERRAHRPRTPAILRDRAGDIVCLHGETNSWPARRPGGHPPEIVQWVARRARTGETFEAVIKPRRPLAPSIPSHIRLSRAQLDAGESWESFRVRWEAFARPDDLLCAWGRYPLDVLESEGLPLPPARLDVRPTAGTYFGTRVGVLEACAERLGVPIPDPFAPGRGGVRLSALSAIVDRMLELTPSAA